MQILLILMVVATLVAPVDTFLGWGPVWSAVLAAFGVLFSWAIAEGSSVWFLTALQRNPDSRVLLLRSYGRVRAMHLALTLAVYVTSLLLGDWNYTVRKEWNLERGVLLDEILVLLPLVLSLIAGWYCFYRTERGFYDLSSSAGAIPFWTRGAYVLFHVRHHLGLALVPILAYTGLHDLLRYLLPTLREMEWFTQVGTLVRSVFPELRDTEWFEFASLASVGMLILLMTPWLLALIWSARSLPAGPLRDRLDAAARRLNFRCSDILLWNTHGGVANAMVTGLLPYPRYVLLSDSLIQNLTPEEVEGVFGHEIGHIRHHHMPLYLIFFVLSMSLITLVTTVLDRALSLGLDDVELSWRLLLDEHAMAWGTGGLGLILFVGTYVWLVFGFLSRRCERQADVYGAKVASCGRADCDGEHVVRESVGAWERESAENPSSTNSHSQAPTLPRSHALTLCPGGIRTFISALEKVADLNGISRGKSSWRHGSIARRVAFLEGLLERPEEEPRFQRRLLLAKCGLLVLLIVAVGALSYCTGRNQAPAGKHEVPTVRSPLARGETPGPL